MRILYLAHRVPDTPSKGDKIRSHHQLRALAERHEVHLFALDDEPGRAPVDPAWSAGLASVNVFPLGRFGARARVLKALLCGGSLSAAHFALPALRRALRGRLQEGVDVAVVFSGAMDPLIPDGTPRVLDLVDVDSAKFAAYHRQGTVRGMKRWIFGQEAERLAELERRATARAELSLLCTEAEARLLREVAQPRRLEVVGNGVDLEAFSFGGAQGRDAQQIAFVGALDYQANVDAVKVLALELLPRVRRQFPKASVLLVGSRPAPAVRQLATLPGVELAADVPSVLPYLHTAGVSVLPFRVARGIQNKALEALAAGLPLVLSASTAQGVEGEPGHDYLVGEGLEELAQHTITLLGDANRREALARRGRQLVEEKYSWKAVLGRFVERVEEVAGDQRGRAR